MNKNHKTILAAILLIVLLVVPGWSYYQTQIVASNINSVLWVGPQQYASVAACYAALPAGGTCMITPGWTDPTWTANLILNKNQAGIVCTGSCFFPMSTFQLIYADGVTGAYFTGPIPQGGPILCTPSGGVVFDYHGAASAIQMGASSGTLSEHNILFSGAFVSLCNAGVGAVAVDMYGIGAHSRVSDVFVAGVVGNSQIGFRLGRDTITDSEGDYFSNLDASATHICFQINGSTIDSIYGLVCNGPNNEAGSIGLDMNATSAGVSAIHVFGTGGIGEYLNPIECHGANGCQNNYVMIETESTGGQPDVTLDASSNQDEFILTGNVAKSSSDLGTHNIVRQPGSNCISGCPGVNEIASITLGSAAASITLPAAGSIPAWARTLRIVIQARSAAAATTDQLSVQINGDTGNDYDTQQLFGNNASASAGTQSGSAFTEMCVIPGASSTRANTAGVCTIDIPNYTGTTFEKQILGIGGFTDSTAAHGFSMTSVGSWRNTAAITSVKIINSSGSNFTAGTQAVLYAVN
jgi:hypothetical protein